MTAIPGGTGFREAQGLRAAVDAFFLDRASKAVREATGGGSPAEVAAGFGDRIAEFIRSSPELVAYARRSFLEGDPAGLALFDALVELARSELRHLAAEGLLRSDLDHDWSALQIVLLSVAPLLLEAAVDRHLDQPFMSEEGMTRWRDATSMLFSRGVYGNADAFSHGADDPERS